MSSWDNPRFENGFRLEGSFEVNYIPGKNPVFAYTFAPGFSWLSVSSYNLIDLVFETEQEGKRKANLMIMTPENGGLAREFEVMYTGSNYYNKLQIYIYASPGKSWPDKTVVIHGVKLKAKQAVRPSFSISVPFTKRRFETPLLLQSRVHTISYQDITFA